MPPRQEVLENTKKWIEEEQKRTQDSLKHFADLKDKLGGTLPKTLEDAERRLGEIEGNWTRARNWVDGELRRLAS